MAIIEVENGSSSPRSRRVPWMSGIPPSEPERIGISTAWNHQRWILVTKSRILGNHFSRSGISFIPPTMYRISWAKVFRTSVTSRIDSSSESSIADIRFSHSIEPCRGSPCPLGSSCRTSGFPVFRSSAKKESSECLMVSYRSSWATMKSPIMTNFVRTVSGLRSSSTHCLFVSSANSRLPIVGFLRLVRASAVFHRMDGKQSRRCAVDCLSLTSCPEDFHDFVAEVVDDLDGDAAGGGLGEGTGNFAVEGRPRLGVDFGFQGCLQ